MNSSVCVYWIRHKDHADIFSQGYVGISNDFETRLRNHKSKPTNIHMKNVLNKYGWENLIKEKVLISTQEYCIDVEKQLRPVDFIGWNQTFGGNIPPKPQKGMGKGRKIPQETIDKMLKTRKGYKHNMKTRNKLSQKAKEQWARYHANGNKHTPEPADEE
jgi:hypothetical protein